LTWLVAAQLEQLLVAGWGGRHGQLLNERPGDRGHDCGGVGVLGVSTPTGELDDLCQHRHALTPCPDVDGTGSVGTGRTAGR
jgi:hypothetical protein